MIFSMYEVKLYPPRQRPFHDLGAFWLLMEGRGRFTWSMNLELWYPKAKMEYNKKAYGTWRTVELNRATNKTSKESRGLCSLQRAIHQKPGYPPLWIHSKAVSMK